MGPFHFLLLSKAIDRTPGTITLHASGNGRVGFNANPTLITATQSFVGNSWVDIYATPYYTGSSFAYYFSGWSTVASGGLIIDESNPASIKVVPNATQHFYANYMQGDIP